MVGLIIGTFFVLIFLAAFHTPTPHRLPVGIVGTMHQAQDVEEALDANAPGTVEFTGYASAAAAQDAVKHKQVYGAYVIAEDGRSAQLLYAGANDPSVTSTLEAIFHAVAQRSGTTMQSKDVLSVSPGDTRSLSIFYTGFGLVLGGYLFGLVSSQMAPRMRLRRRLVSLVAFSVLGGITAALIAGSVGFNALPGNLATIMAVTIVLAMAVGSATLPLMRIGGPLGNLLAPLILLILGNATSGGVLPPAYLPDWLRPLSEILPAGLGVSALQAAAYFGGDAYLRGIVLLLVWTLGSIGVVYALDLAVDHRSDGPPAATPPAPNA